MTTAFERMEPGARKANKRHILASALACFDEQGIDATTIEHIRQRADSSIGTIYHHFGSKEGLIAALFFVALADQQAQMEAVIEHSTTAEQTVKGIIGVYMEWVAAQPELARFMFQARTVVGASEHQNRLNERNKSFYRRFFVLLAEAQDRNEIKALPTEVYMPLIIGQAESYCRAWLSGRVHTSPKQYVDVFAQAVWQSLEPW